MDYNRDRWGLASVSQRVGEQQETSRNFLSQRLGSDGAGEATVQLGTLAPLLLRGPGSYALSVVKQFAATPEFLRLEERQRGCQMEETVTDCHQRHLLAASLETCSCIPFHLRQFSPQVGQIIIQPF